jgi:hypothetical protein
MYGDQATEAPKIAPVAPHPEHAFNFNDVMKNVNFNDLVNKAGQLLDGNNQASTFQNVSEKEQHFFGQQFEFSNPFTKSDTADHQLIAQVTDGIRDAKSDVDKFHESVGKVIESHDVPSAVIDEFKRVVNAPDRNHGEYAGAIGTMDGHTWGSSMIHGDGIEADGHEYHAESGQAQLQLKGGAFAYATEHYGKVKQHYQLEALVHTHPDKDAKHDSMHFSDTDMQQANELHVKSYLLTPAPSNKVLEYEPGSNNPNGKEIGHFDAKGNFIAKQDKPGQ